MEQLFGMQNMLSDLMVQLGDGQQATISFELRDRADPNGPNLLPPRIFRMRNPIPTSPLVGQDETQHPYKMAGEFMSLETSARWQQAASMWFQTVAADRAATYEQSIFKLLKPAAVQEEKRRKAKEEADRKAAEVAKKAKEEEERRVAQEEAEARAKVEAEAREREEAKVAQKKRNDTTTRGGTSRT